MRERFFKRKIQTLTVQDIAKITGAEIVRDLGKEFNDVATLQNGGDSDISFLNSGQYAAKFADSNVGCCLIEEKFIDKAPENMSLLVHKNPYFAYSKLAGAIYDEGEVDFSTKNLVHPESIRGENCNIAPNAYIGKNVEIGDNCYIGPNAVIMDNCIIGNNCKINAGAIVSYATIGDNSIIYNGASIGQDGFGFAHDNGVNHKIIQLGIVEIGKDVEVGANACVDRGALENTIIGNGTKLDNMVQIGHNVKIGQGTVIAGCTALAGSSQIGNYVQIGGNASIAGHLKINDGAKIAGMSGVTKEVAPMQAMAGIPAVPIRDWHKASVTMARLIKAKKSD